MNVGDGIGKDPTNDKIKKCGCCEGDTKDECSPDGPVCVDNNSANWVCGTDGDGLVEVRYCTNKDKPKCEDPFKTVKDGLQNCGNC